MATISQNGDGNKQQQPQKKKKAKAFYETPEDRPTSAKIIEDTRTWLMAVSTKRPFTPRDVERALFERVAEAADAADKSSAASAASTPVSGGGCRPPSAVSLGGRGFESDSRPVSGTRLSPIGAPKPPSAEQRRRHRHSGGGGVAAVVTEDTDSEAEIYNSRLAPIVDQLTLADALADPGDALALVRRLHRELRRADLLGRNCRRHRTQMLRPVFRLLEAAEPRLLMELASLTLALQVSANNLVNVSKLLFRLAKQESNDPLFLEAAELLPAVCDTLASSDPAANHEALVYLTGTLKFLTSNAGVCRDLLARCGCLTSLVACLGRIVDRNLQAGGRPAESLAHVLVQVLGALRNLAEHGPPGTRECLIASRSLPAVCAAMRQYLSDAELQLNAARLLSKLSQHADACTELMTTSGPDGCQLVATARELLVRHRGREDLVVRLAFVLGNLTGRDEAARAALLPDRAALDCVLGVLKYYCQAESDASAAASDRLGRDRPARLADCLVKLVRLLANSAISAGVGAVCAASRTCLRLLVTIVETKPLPQYEELVSNSVSAINNLTYYMLPSLAQDMTERMLRVSQALHSLIQQCASCGDSTALTTEEAVRPFGNLSREPAVRAWMLANRMDGVLLQLLDSHRCEAVYSAAGILLNLVADPDKRSLLSRGGGVQKLVSALIDLGQSDWQLACVICQALWNYTEDMADCTESFGGEQVVQDLIGCLELYTDEAAVEEANRSTAGSDEDTFNHLQQVWETDFSYVGSHLLKRLRRSLN